MLCSLDLRDLSDFSYTNDAGEEMLKAVPVLVTNYRDAAGNAVNSGEYSVTSCTFYHLITCNWWLLGKLLFVSLSLDFICSSKKRDDVITLCYSGGDRSRWQLVRRFFKVDRVSGNTTDLSGTSLVMFLFNSYFKHCYYCISHCPVEWRSLTIFLFCPVLRRQRGPLHRTLRGAHDTARGATV